MTLRKYTAALFLPVFFLLIARSLASGAAQDLIEAANKEGGLVLYGGGALPDITKLVANFNRTYPCIKVDYLRKSATSLFGLIIGELRTKTYKAGLRPPARRSGHLPHRT